MEELPVTLRLLILFGLLGVNGFFAAAEVAFVSVRQTRMRELADAGERRARIVVDLLRTPDRMLSAVQLGVTLASLGLGWAGESAVHRLIAPVLVHVLPEGADQAGRFAAFLLAFSAITFLHMVLGEVVPKNLALERSERLSLAVAPAFELFARTTGFFVSLVKGASARLSRVLGLRMASREEGYTAEELKLIVSVSKKTGEHALQQEELIHRVIDFYDVTVREVMTPRQEMVALPAGAGIDQVIDCISRKRHSRIPIYEGSAENVVGAIFAKDIWSFVHQMRRWEMLGRPTPQFVLRSYLRNVEFVPETKLLYELLEEFQARRYQLAMVVDEFGTVSGLVTIEDALEQIVGEIREEHETPAAVQPGGELIELDGITNIRDLENLHGIELPYDAGFETLAGFLLSRLGHVPEPGEAVEHEGRRFTILQMDRNRIGRVRIETNVAGPHPPNASRPPIAQE